MITTKTITLDKISTLADGLNIEGPLPWMLLNKNYKKIWGNFVVVLDRPLIDNIVFDDILKNNKYPMLENAIDNLNENNFLVLFLSTLCYYVANSRELIRESGYSGNTLIRESGYSGNTLIRESGYSGITDRKINIIVHFHQDITCYPLMKIFQSYFDILCKQFELDLSTITINYISDSHTYHTMYPTLFSDMSAIYNEQKFIENSKSIDCYDNVDILLSFSQCAGLSDVNIPGNIILPVKYIPFDINKGIVYESNAIDVNDGNHFKKTLSAIVNSSIFREVEKVINEQYHSFNPNKKHLCNKFAIDDIIYGAILHANGLWNPVDNKEKLLVN
jgi:hypothetical protein